MKNIFIGFSKPSHFKVGSELIRLWMQTPYSHVYIRFNSDSLNLSSVYHAANKMVHFREYENFKHDNTVIKEYKISLTQDQYNNLLRKCMKLSGEEYGYIELGKIALYDTMNSLGMSIKTYDDKGYICSELVGELCTDVLGIEFDKPKYLLKPIDIDNMLGVNYG